MQDLTLGTFHDMEEYCGPYLHGQPLHGGSCSDGVYGCNACNAASRHLNDDELKAIGFPTEEVCEWCEKSVPSADIRLIRPWDEPSCCYEVCRSCDLSQRSD